MRSKTQTMNKSHYTGYWGVKWLCQLIHPCTSPITAAMRAVWGSLITNENTLQQSELPWGEQTVGLTRFTCICHGNGNLYSWCATTITIYGNQSFNGPFQLWASKMFMVITVFEEQFGQGRVWQWFAATKVRVVFLSSLWLYKSAVNTLSVESF